MKIQILLANCLLFGASGVATADVKPTETPLTLSTIPKIAEVDPRFQSYNVEMAEIIGGRFWAPYPKPGEKSAPENTKPSGGLGLEAKLFRQREPADLMGSPALLNMARALGPAYIRVSGSWANTVFFQDDELPRLTQPPKGYSNVLSRAQWAGVVSFAKAVDGQIVMSFPVSAGTRNEAGDWTPDQARKLLRYTRAIGGHIHSAELINEPNLGATSGLPSNYAPNSFARDIATFRAFVTSDAPDLKTIGPGSTGETGVSLFPNQGMATEAMLSAEPHPQFDIFSYHFYGARSQRCARMAPQSAIQPKDALSEAWLARTDTALSFYKDLRDRYVPGAPIWLTETAQASCGGDQWAASFLDSFRYIDQLGRLAKQGVSAVFHNTLAASDYALIDESTLTPRPNYWAALLWRRLLGEVVLDAGPAKAQLHLYAHCLREQPGGVALVVINLDQSKKARLALPFTSQRYTLSAQELQSGVVKLNGKPLALVGNELPVIKPIKAPAGEVMLEPATITFLAVPGAGNSVCR